jgi:hypothetical protein
VGLPPDMSNRCASACMPAVSSVPFISRGRVSPLWPSSGARLRMRTHGAALLSWQNRKRGVPTRFSISSTDFWGREAIRARVLTGDATHEPGESRETRDRQGRRRGSTPARLEEVDPER